MKKAKVIFLLLLFPALLFAQEKVLTGKVTDNTGEGIPGVNVILKGTTTGTVTNIDGVYRLPLESTQGITLSFSFIGFKTQDVEVGSSTTIDVVLESGDINLDEVVVTAMGIKREAKSLAYARQSVGTEEMAEARSTNFINSLSGKAAGVQVVNSSTPTGSNRVVIRGLTSVTGNNQPLYVVDGIPLDDTQGDNSVSVWGGNASGQDIDYGSPISQINPDDIESMEILKGPNAAALYGSRASNGVVLITTKKGTKKQGLGISVNSNTQFTQILEYPYYQYVYGTGSAMRTGEQAKHFDSETGYANLGYTNRAYGAPMLGQMVMGWDGEPMQNIPNVDNVKELFQTGVTYTNGVTLERASDKGSFRLSYTNTSSEFVIEDFEKQSRHNLSLRASQELTKKLKTDVSLMYTRDHVENRLYQNGSEKNPANNYMYMMPAMSEDNLIPYKDELGNAFNYNGSFNNPYWNLYENSNQDESNRIIGQVSLEWEIIKGLSLRGKAMGDVNSIIADEFNNKGASYDPDGFYRTIDRQTQNWNFESILNYTKKINDFSIVGMLGANRFEYLMSRRETRIGSLLVSDVKSLSNSSAIPEVIEEDGRKRINSIFGSASFGWKDIIYLDATARNDWSSTLPAENNSYFYPSVGTSLLFSELIPENDILTFGKVRASYAQVGNDTQPYRVLTTYGYGGNYNNTAWLDLQDTRNNPNLKPELTTSYEVGLETSFLNNRVSLNATWYTSSTINQIIPAQTTAATGFASQVFNAGEIQSEGWELFLSAKPFDKKFKWNIDINWSTNESLVVELIDGIDRLLLREWYNAKVWAEVGKPLGEIRGDINARDPETGVILLKGNGRPIWDVDQRLGNAQPDWIGGLRNSFSYKGFNLSVLVDVKMGGDIYSGTMLKAMNHGMRGETYPFRDEYFFSSLVLGESGNELKGQGLYGNDYADSERVKGQIYEGASLGVQDENGNWVATRDENGNVVEANIWLNPQVWGYDPIHRQEDITYDASYVKLREVVFGYNIPKTLLQNTPLQSARVSLVGRNLWTIHDNMPQGLDPEANTTSGNGQGIEFASFLPTRSLGFNINVSF
ncbi:SusC/RagA family TonB-linked outer membrane protein [uncultured Draconibacterium sp.]|uniref:SusC/RagA family TonB-linked outer membrane protein n=1 Tax=uncultured Draconibacterium sp. TaxID=1573823 RepID=UPI0029C7CA1A|nr:SusC/RagA family TonB-linked outer membrane protein [uncultured Draconibacterium sp.]